MKAETNAQVIDLTHERTLKENLQRQLLEIDISLERGELALLAPVEAKDMSKVMTMKAEYLAIPEKIRHLISTEYGVDISIDYIEDITHKMLTTFSETAGKAVIDNIPAGKLRSR